MTTTTEHQMNLTGEVLTEPIDAPRHPRDLKMYFDMLATFGLACPSGEAVEAWERSHTMASERRRVLTEKLDLGTLGQELGRGRVGPKDAEKAVAASTSEEVRHLLETLYTIAQREAVKACREFLQQAGDQLLESPRALIQRALADPEHVDSAELYGAGVRLLGVVHGFGTPRAERADLRDYLYRRPALVQEWVRENGGKAPTPRDIAVHADDWGPGVYTAAEVLEALRTDT